MAEQMTTDEVVALLTDRLATVLGIDGPVTADSRFDEDLHADSLDLVEVVESVEQELRTRGHTPNVDDDALLAAETVGDAAALIQAGLGR
ncbi:MAG TPA: phosphopantetheine-binding protein [Egibacteraceae bacterium]|nr:phosphopantetheine-binding protein [Egibacteraceae bacterium]